jgi:hypothetical protein
LLRNHSHREPVIVHPHKAELQLLLHLLLINVVDDRLEARHPGEGLMEVIEDETHPLLRGLAHQLLRTSFATTATTPE